jgi:hypothetical protein
VADWGTPVAQNVDVSPNKGIQTLSGILGLRQQQQALQIGAGQVQQTQRQMAARDFLNRTMQSGQDESGQSILDASGHPDPTKLVATIGRNLPADLAQPVIQNIIKTQTDKVGLQNAALGLDVAGRGMLMGAIQGALTANKPGTAAIANINTLLQEHPDNQLLAIAAQHAKGLVQHLDNIPRDQVPAAVNGLAANLQAGQQVPVVPTTTELATGAQTLVGTRAPAVAGGEITAAQSVPSQLPPQIVRTPAGPLEIWGGVKGGGGGGTAKTPKPQPGSQSITADQDPNRPDYNAPDYVQKTWGDTVAQANKMLTDTRTVDQDYGNNMAIAGHVRALADMEKPGPGTEEFNRVVGSITRFHGDQHISNMQELQSWLDRQASVLRTAQGIPPTNAGEAMAQTISGNIGMMAGAVRAKNAYNEALTESYHMYRQGLDHVGGFTGRPSPTVIGKFQAAWANNFDPTAMEWVLAKQNGDTKMVNAIESMLAKMPPAQRALIQQHGRNMDLLAQGSPPGG